MEDPMLGGCTMRGAPVSGQATLTPLGPTGTLVHVSPSGPATPNNLFRGDAWCTQRSSNAALNVRILSAALQGCVISCNEMSSREQIYSLLYHKLVKSLDYTLCEL